MDSAAMVIGWEPWRRTVSAIVAVGWEDRGGREEEAVEDEAEEGEGMRWGVEEEEGGFRWVSILYYRVV